MKFASKISILRQKKQGGSSRFYKGKYRDVCQDFSLFTSFNIVCLSEHLHLSVFFNYIGLKLDGIGCLGFLSKEMLHKESENRLGD